ncbi:Transcriptional regulator, TetR family [Frankia canadensis]|uniref:Transcriptional regulator, TetR family n=1 Tax=Frankia canadensis TaxID=1836972 RepID=A0A2I2KVB6_9ACTN|nr:TetR/AcrR family transcriptional regulator [Frankia canadensis]SNQ49598.1 Transcriptional regulator, TetR family [Frankia canadensis]SOU56888.1 Transcriptional regulator, TetR family [Frankia canadensis]
MGQSADQQPDVDSRPYHHGALRSQLLAAGLELVKAEGVGALSLRRLAREAGVSSGAPYHHFADRAELIAAIVVDGHELLFTRLETARAVSSDAVAALRELLVAYASFAVDHSAHLRVMLRPELAEPDAHPEVTSAGARPIELLRSIVQAAQDEGAVAPGDPEPMVHLIWSLAVGYVTLWLDGPVEARCAALGTTADDMIRQVASTVEELLRRPRT